MEYFPAPLEKLVEQFARLPGIGGKSAQRLAFYVLGLPEEEAREFADAILDAKHSVTCCPVCQNFTAGGLCPICASPKRDGSTICVVADPRDVAAIERSREYNGRYHVLHGVISPMNHVGQGYAIPNPEDTPYIEELAQLEGILLDPVYTGKAWSGMLKLLQEGGLGGRGDILFVHTGGAAALFAMDLA